MDFLLENKSVEVKADFQIMNHYQQNTFFHRQLLSHIIESVSRISIGKSMKSIPILRSWKIRKVEVDGGKKILNPLDHQAANHTGQKKEPIAYLPEHYLGVNL